MAKDDTIQIQVMAEIRRDPLLYEVAAEIGVSVKDEVVTLFGTVDQDAQRFSAERAALRVQGVNIVALDIKLKGAGNPNFVTDSEIGKTINKTLKNYGTIDTESINIHIENGWIYLEGILKWASDKLTVKRLIEKVPGVKKVINKIKIKHRFPNPDEIKKVILSELERYPFFDAENIEVKVEGQTVILCGEVQSSRDTEDAEVITNSIPGVKKVINSLTVDFEVYAS